MPSQRPTPDVAPSSNPTVQMLLVAVHPTARISPRPPLPYLNPPPPFLLLWFRGFSSTFVRLGFRVRPSSMASRVSKFQRGVAGSSDCEFSKFEAVGLECGEPGTEICVLGDLRLSLPIEFFDLEDLSSVFNVQTWNEGFSVEERLALSKFLPDMDQMTFGQTLIELFSGKSFYFGNPVKCLFDGLKRRFYEPDVVLFRRSFNAFQRRQHYYFLKEYHDSMVRILMEMKAVWEQSGAFSVEEKVQALNALRSQRPPLGKGFLKNRYKKRPRVGYPKAVERGFKCHGPPPMGPRWSYGDRYSKKEDRGMDAVTEAGLMKLDDGGSGLPICLGNSGKNNPNGVGAARFNGLQPVRDRIMQTELWEEAMTVDHSMKFGDDFKSEDKELKARGGCEADRRIISLDSENPGCAAYPSLPIMMFQTLDEKKRFRELKSLKNPGTISPSCKEVRALFRREEALRYSVADRPFSYTAADGRKSSVAPLRGGGSKATSKVRHHYMLKFDRPAHVTIHCLVRDAAARLPGSMGTRADVSTLLKDSQYIVEELSDTNINRAVSGALDRLRDECDPCVRFDNDKKLWVYLHGDRQAADFDDEGTSSLKKWKRAKKNGGGNSYLGEVNRFGNPDICGPQTGLV